MPIQTTFQSLQTIIEGGQLPQDTHRDAFITGIEAIVAKSSAKFSPISKQFSHALLDSFHLHLHHEYLLEHIEEIKFMACKNNKAYSFKGAEYRGFVISGKAVSVYLRKKKHVEGDDPEFQHRDQFCSLVVQGIIRMFDDGKIFLTKDEKNFSLPDILLDHDMPDAKTDEVFMGPEVYSPFVPIQKTIVMLVPFKILKPDCIQFLKSSILHSYVDEAPLMSRIIQKQTFYKNSILRGLYFIDDGEVEVPSGRIIARGWTCFGKCKVSGCGWKFKPIPFARFLSKNPAIWKQFLNDLQLNEEYPFNIIHILGLNDDEDFTSSAEWKSLGKKKFGGKSTKLPRLSQMQMQYKSFDEAKYIEIEKLRHYDERINDVFTYKQDLLTRKLKGIVHGKFEPIFRSEEAEKKLEQKKKIMERLNSKKSQVFKKKMTQPDLSGSQPAENILIISVLKRLESIADLDDSQHQSEFMFERGNRSPLRVPVSHTKRQNIKVSPMQLYERSRSLKKKNNRYKL